MTATKVGKKDRIEEELKTILADSPDGLLHAEAVVAYAKENPDSALSTKFPWDDAEAARLKRLDIARGIIRVYRIIVSEVKPEPFRAYVSLTSDRKNGGGYRATATVLNNEEMRRQLLADAYRSMRTFMTKYQVLTELSGVFAEMERVLTPAPEKATA